MHWKSLTVLAVTLIAAGLTTPALAVSGGESVPDPAVAPWMVTIAAKGTDTLLFRDECGGVLISRDRIATASHCLDGSDPNRIEVHLGASILNSNPGRILAVKGFATHPGYRIIPSPIDPDNFYASAAADDVAIIQLARPVRDVRPVPVAHRSPGADTSVQVYGHGLTESILSGSGHSVNTILGDVLQRGDLKTISHSACVAQLGNLIDKASVLCAQGAATTCSGDSGGPLLHRTARGPELVGLMSFGGEVIAKDCGEGAYPGAFADAAVFRSWILQPDPVLAPRPLAEPRITGVRAVGVTVSCHPPAWAGPAPTTVRYQWERGDEDSDGSVEFQPLDGATKADLTVTSRLAHHQLLCGVSAGSAGGTVNLRSAAL